MSDAHIVGITVFVTFVIAFSTAPYVWRRWVTNSFAGRFRWRGKWWRIVPDDESTGSDTMINTPPTDLAALRAMAGAVAKLLPFSHHGREGIDQNHVVRMSNGQSFVVEDAIYHSAALAEFVTTACNATPALVAEVEMLRAEHDELKRRFDATVASMDKHAADMRKHLEWECGIRDRWMREADTARAEATEASMERDVILRRYLEASVWMPPGEINDFASVDISGPSGIDGMTVAAFIRRGALNRSRHKQVIQTDDPERDAITAAAHWQQLIDAARAGASGSSTPNEQNT